MEVFRGAEEGDVRAEEQNKQEEQNKDKKNKKIKRKLLIPQKRTRYVFLPNSAYHSQTAKGWTLYTRETRKSYIHKLISSNERDVYLSPT